MASGDTDRRVYQLMDKDGGDLHRQSLDSLRSGPDEDLKMPILATLIIPALAYVPAAPAA